MRTLLGLLATLASLAAVGCGQSEEERVAAVVERLQEGFAAGDPVAVCDAMTAGPAHEIGSFGHRAEPTICTRDVLAWMESDDLAAGSGGKHLMRAPKPEVVDVDIARSGGSAVATMSLGDHPFELRLVREHGEWRVDDFLGVTAPPPKALR